MSLLDVNYNIRNQSFSEEEITCFFSHAYKKVRNADWEDKSFRKENLNLIEKAMLMQKYNRTIIVTITDFLLILAYVIVYMSYNSFFEESSFNEVLGDLGDIIKSLETRVEKLSKSFFKFFDFYVIVLTIAALGIIGSILMPNLLGFFPTVLGGILVFLFLFLLFRGRFIGAFLVPGAIIFLADFIEKYIPKESMLKVGLLVFIGSIVILAIRFVFKKLAKLGVITTAKQKKINQLNTELSYYKETVETILAIFSFTCDKMVQTLRQCGISEEEIEKDVAYVNEFLMEDGGTLFFLNLTNKVSAYYKYVLERLNKIEINEE